MRTHPITPTQDNGESAQGHRPGAGGGTTSQNRGTSGRKPGGGGKGGLAPGFRTTQHTAVDPSEAEEDVMKGRITFALTAHKEVGEVGVTLTLFRSAGERTIGFGWACEGCGGGRRDGRRKIIERSIFTKGTHEPFFSIHVQLYSM